jgi:hypothetical protein
VEGVRITVENPDLLDGTPILDIKPYIPVVEAFPESKAGWLNTEKPGSPEAYDVEIEPRAREQEDWLASKFGIRLLHRAGEILTHDPRPHPYKRIKAAPAGTLVLSIKSWRVRYRVEGTRVVITEIASGFSRKALAEGKSTRKPLHDEEAHRDFQERF